MPTKKTKLSPKELKKAVAKVKRDISLRKKKPTESLVPFEIKKDSSHGWKGAKEKKVESYSTLPPCGHPECATQEGEHAGDIMFALQEEMATASVDHNGRYLSKDGKHMLIVATRVKRPAESKESLELLKLAIKAVRALEKNNRLSDDVRREMRRNLQDLIQSQRDVDLEHVKRITGLVPDITEIPKDGFLKCGLRIDPKDEDFWELFDIECLHN